MPASSIRIDQQRRGERPHRGDPAWVRWLTRSLHPDDRAIEPQLTRLLYGSQSSIAFGVLCVALLLACYSRHFDGPTLAIMVAVFVPSAVMRYRMIGYAERVDSPTALLVAGLNWAIFVGLLCAAGGRSGDTMLMILSGLVAVAISMGGAYINAGIPRFASTQTVLFLMPYALAIGTSGMPGMRLVLAQVPIWFAGIFMLTRTMHRTHAKLIRTQNLAHRLAFHDGLTGLPNRANFMERLTVECERTAQADRGTSYVLYLDLDGFKPVNDTYGHATGDDVLCTITHRFAAALRPLDILGRLGGDEFAVILCDVTAAQAEAIGRRLIATAREPICLADRPPITIGVSIGGVALAPPPDVRRTLAAADTMLYAAKRGGKGMLRMSAAA